MIFAHAFIGQILAYFLVPRLETHEETVSLPKWLRRFAIPAQFHITKKVQRVLLWLIFILASIFPDIDILYILFINPDVSHRTLFTHSLIPYLVLVWAIVLIARYKKLPKFTISASSAFIVGIFFHLLADMFAEEIYPFNPIFPQSYQLLLYNVISTQGLTGYFKSPYMAVEVLIIVTGISLLINTFKKFNNELKFLLTVSGIILVLAAITVTPFLQ